MPDPADPQSLNRYSYVGNRPTSLIDPTGNNPACAAVPHPIGAFACYVFDKVVQYGPQVAALAQQLAVNLQQLGTVAAQMPAAMDANNVPNQAPQSSNAGNTGDPGGLDPKDPWFGRLLTGQETRQLTEKATQLGEERITVIGRWKPTGGGPNYIDVAERMRATFLELETPIASRLTPEQFNQVNAQFLRDAVARGDRIFLGTEIGRMVGQLAWEIAFLKQELGLVLGPDGWFLPK